MLAPVARGPRISSFATAWSMTGFDRRAAPSGDAAAVGTPMTDRESDGLGLVGDEATEGHGHGEKILCGTPRNLLNPRTAGRFSGAHNQGHRA